MADDEIGEALELLWGQRSGQHLDEAHDAAGLPNLGALCQP
ncbi:hypothetical protein [Streptomyces hirsutus]